MLEKEEVYFRCLERWNANDEKTAYFEQHYDEWFSQLPEEIHEVVLQLLEMFMYYSQERVNQYLFELHPKLEGKIEPETTLYTPLLSGKGIVNSSVDYLCTYRQMHRISKYQVALDIDTYIANSSEKFENVQNIVIVDDYCGSGKSLKTFIEGHNDSLKGKRIYYLVTYFMIEAQQLIDEISEQYEISIEVIYINSGKRAFDDERFSEHGSEVRKAIKRCSKKLKIPTPLGLYKTESLVSFYNDTPNNTIGIFWCDTNIYFSIFPREFENTEGLKRPTLQSLKRQKEERVAQNYTSAMRKAQNE